VWPGTVHGDHAEPGQAGDKFSRNRRALAQQDQSLGIRESRGQNLDIPGVVVPDLDFMACELREARQRAREISVVVQYRNLQRRISSRVAGTGGAAIHAKRAAKIVRQYRMRCM
jgi:hypothetical protein